MNEIYPITKLGDQILIINKDDLPYIGKERALEVKCVKVDLRYKTIDPIIEIEKHFKFNPWEEISADEKDIILQNLNTKFSNQDILEKIIEPLAKSALNPSKLVQNSVSHRM